MVVSKRVERERGREKEDDTELLISQHWLYTLQGTIAMRSFGLSKISIKMLMFFILTLKDNETFMKQSSLQGWMLVKFPYIDFK